MFEKNILKYDIGEHVTFKDNDETRNFLQRTWSNKVTSLSEEGKQIKIDALIFRCLNETFEIVDIKQLIEMKLYHLRAPCGIELLAEDKFVDFAY